MFQQYYKKDFQRYIPDWITTIIIFLAFACYLEWAIPYARPFKLSNPDIQHQFAEVQIVNDFGLYVLTFIIPLTIMCALIFTSKKDRYEQVHHLHMTLLAFTLNFVSVGAVTDFLKIWISRPRPDFLSRCLPKPDTPLDTYVTIEVCSTFTEATNWRLIDGMKSCPSGHSSLAMSGAIFLALWLTYEWKLTKTSSVHWWILSWGYVLVGACIGISRSIDYRHHLTDILFGFLLGGVGAFLSYKKYFPIETMDNLPL